MITKLPRKAFEINLPDGKVIAGQFGTWCLKRFCDRSKCTLDEVQERLKKPSLDDLCNFLLSAVEQTARETGNSFSYTDVNVCNWIDQMGGLSSVPLQELFSHSSSDIPSTDEEKKTVLTGENSNDVAA